MEDISRIAFIFPGPANVMCHERDIVTALQCNILLSFVCSLLARDKIEIKPGAVRGMCCHLSLSLSRIDLCVTFHDTAWRHVTLATCDGYQNWIWETSLWDANVECDNLISHKEMRKCWEREYIWCLSTGSQTRWLREETAIRSAAMIPILGDQGWEEEGVGEWFSNNWHQWHNNTVTSHNTDYRGCNDSGHELIESLILCLAP